MTRILMIDTNQALAEAIGSQCLKHGIAVRFADDLCKGLRQLLDTPVSLVLVEAARLPLSNVDLVRLFEAVIPGVPVVIRLDAEGELFDPGGPQVATWRRMWETSRPVRTKRARSMTSV